MPQITPLMAGDPQRLGSFTLSGRVGEGGQGIVYLGVDEQGEPAAIKLLHVKFSGDASARARFARELKAAKRVMSFCTAGVIEADLDGNTPYIASEYIDGLPLREVVEAAGPLTGAALDRLAIGTATALTAIHHASIIHRDFKPDNVLIAADGPRVVDFGIARIIDSSGTITSRAIGTPAYMAPEQIAGEEIGPYTDVFAWGATIAYAATGVSVFEGSSIAVVLNRILTHEVDVESLHEPLRGVVRAALAKDPRERPSADEILLRLLGRPAVARIVPEPQVTDDTRPFTKVKDMPSPGEAQADAGVRAAETGQAVPAAEQGRQGQGTHAGQVPRTVESGGRPRSALAQLVSSAQVTPTVQQQDASESPGAALPYGTAESPGAALPYGTAGAPGAAHPYGTAGAPGTPLPYGTAGSPGTPLPYGTSEDAPGTDGTSMSFQSPNPPEPESRAKAPWIAVTVTVVLVLAAAVAMAMASAGGWAFLTNASAPGGHGGTPPAFASVAEKIAATGKLTIGVRDDVPGVGYRGNADAPFEGFDIDIAHRLAVGLGVKDPAKVTFVPLSKAERTQALRDGRVDLVIATFSITGDDLQFAGPYYLSHQDVLVRDDSGIAALADLKNKILCNQGSGAVGRVQDRVGVRLVNGTDYADCIRKISDGTADAMAGDDLILAGFANRENTRYKIIGARLSTERYAVALAKGDARTCAAIKGAISGFYADGVQATLVKTYFPNVRFKPDLKVPAMEPCR